MENLQEQKLPLVHYRPIVRKLYYWLVFALAAIELLIYRIHYKELESAGLVFGSFKFLALSSVPIGILIRLVFIVRPRIFSNFTLDGNSLWISRGKNKDEIHFSQVKELKKSLLPPQFFGGFYLVLNSGKRFFFSSIIKNEEHILEGLQKYNPSLMEEKKFSRLIDRTRSTDLYWKQVVAKLKKPYYLPLKLFSSSLLCLSMFHFSLHRSLDLGARLEFKESVLIFILVGLLFQIISGVVLSNLNHLQKTLAEDDKKMYIDIGFEVAHFLLGTVFLFGFIELFLYL